MFRGEMRDLLREQQQRLPETMIAVGQALLDTPLQHKEHFLLQAQVGQRPRPGGGNAELVHSFRLATAVLRDSLHVLVAGHVCKAYQPLQLAQGFWLGAVRAGAQRPVHSIPLLAKPLVECPAVEVASPESLAEPGGVKQVALAVA